MRYIRALLAALLILVATISPASAHGHCHPYDFGRLASDGPYSTSYISTVLPSYTTVLRADVHSNTIHTVTDHVGQSVWIQATSITGPTDGKAEMGVIWDDDGQIGEWRSRIDTNNDGVWDLTDSGPTSTFVITLEMRFEDSWPLDYWHFYVEGVEVMVYAAFPLFTAEGLKVYAKQGSTGQHEYFGTSVDPTVVDNIEYTQGTTQDFPDSTIVHSPWTGYQAGSMTQNGRISFYDLDCS